MDQVAVMLPGAGSSASFVARAFGEPLRAAGYRLVTPPVRPGPGVVAAALAALDDAVATYPGLRLVGGVSLGAHLAARWAATRCAGPGNSTPGLGHSSTPGPGDRTPGPAGGRSAGLPGAAGSVPADLRVGLDGVLLVLPAWTGPPEMVAAATATAADTIDRLGTAGALAAAGDAVPWVAAELAAAWPAYGDQLASSLRAAAAAPGPTIAELASLRLPAGLVAFSDDPLHPYGVAREWAAALPQAALRTLHLADAAGDPAVLGRTALAALDAAGREHPTTRRA